MKSETIHDGGPAFPVTDANDEVEGGRFGMSLRDWFAGQAMQGLCSAGFSYMSGEGHATDAAMEMMKDIGVVSYQMADSMLAERNRRNRE